MSFNRNSMFAAPTIEAEIHELYMKACADDFETKKMATSDFVKIFSDYFKVSPDFLRQSCLLERQTLKHAIALMRKKLPNQNLTSQINEIEALVGEPAAWRANSIINNLNGELVINYPSLSLDQRKLVIQALNEEYVNVGKLFEEFYNKEFIPWGEKNSQYGILFNKAAFCERMLPTLANIYEREEAAEKVSRYQPK